MLQEKKSIYILWKKEWAAQGEYKEVVCKCREKRRKAKANLEVNTRASQGLTRAE